MVQIVLADSAWTDLESIGDYIALDSPRYASEFIEAILDHLHILYDFPKAGRVVPEFEQDDTRELIFGHYRIVYWLKNDESIIILRVIHGSKLLDL